MRQTFKLCLLGIFVTAAAGCDDSKAPSDLGADTRETLDTSADTSSEVGSDVTVTADVSANADTSPTADASSEPPEAGSELLRFCGYYKTCGGTFYDTAEECVEASVDYWGECRIPALDALGTCMLGVPCEDWDPDTYNPADTVCAEEYKAVTDADCP